MSHNTEINLEHFNNSPSSQGYESVKVASIADLYLDYVNNFTTTSRFANHYGLTNDEAFDLITLGRSIHERMVKVYKDTIQQAIKAKIANKGFDTSKIEIIVC